MSECAAWGKWVDGSFDLGIALGIVPGWLLKEDEDRELDEW